MQKEGKQRKIKEISIFHDFAKMRHGKTLDFIGFFEGRFYDEITISCDTKKGT